MNLRRRLAQPLLALTLLCSVAQAPAQDLPKAAVDEARKASTVPEIASAVSRKYGARVTRVSLTPRNPALGWGDAWEQQVLMDFEQRVAKGEAADGMEHAAVVNEPAGRFLRCMRVLPMQAPCMHCHGPVEQISESVRSQLAHDCPHDRAAGLTLGKVRGSVTYKKPL